MITLGTLKPVKQTSRFDTLDIETYKRGFILAGIYSKNKYRPFTDFTGLMDFLVNRKESFYFIHNLRFDGIYICNYLDKRGIDYDFKDSDGKMMELKIFKRTETKKSGRQAGDKVKRFITLRDSFSLFPMSQKSLAEMFNVPVKKLDVDFKELESKPLKESMPTYLERNRTDVIGLHQILTQAQEQIFDYFGVDIKRTMTTAMMSMNSFRTDYLPAPLVNPLLTGKARNLMVLPEAKFFTDSYAGGRTEVFNLNEFEKVRVYDVNSMYPSAMLQEMPVGRFKIFDNTTKKHLRDLMQGFQGFAEVTLSTRPEKYPLLWARVDKKLLFMDFKKSRGVFAFPELRKVLENGAKILEVHRAVVFPECSPLFKEFVIKIYKDRVQAKKEGNHALSYILKLVLNSLYGKFAQKPEKGKTKIIDPSEVLSCKGDVEFNGEHFYTTIIESRPARFYMPFISSYITSIARVKLYDYIRAADNPIYVDTDSVVCDWMDEDSTALGKMALERELTNFKAFNPKVYQSAEIKKAKGIPQHLLDEIQDLSELYKKAVKWDSLCSLKASLKVRNSIVYGDGLVKYVTRTRSFRKGYAKRSVNPDLSTLPFVFSCNQAGPRKCRG